MAKVLGLDLGTNSLGWALVDESENEYTLIDKGVDIFQEGVARDKNNEKPAVQDRTSARALRRHYFRRRLRKIELLKILIRYDLCPPLPEAVDRLAKRNVTRRTMNSSVGSEPTTMGIEILTTIVM